ncbi:hypothetical protein [Falsiroseomonas sp.]|uniref:hypothetical protein n=1 Tax=Falsiroseomonas sp. TaxID=2870721 RepID=UPI003F72088B
MADDLAAFIDGLGREDSAGAEGRQAARLLIDALGVAVYATDVTGTLTYYNEAAATLWGRRPALHDQRWCGSWRIVAPDGSTLPHDQCPMAVCLKEGKAVRGAWAYAERPDGVRIPFAPFPPPSMRRTGSWWGR